MDPSSFAWELRIAQAEALLQAAERDKRGALQQEQQMERSVAAAAAGCDAERLALAKAEQARYGLAAELMTCAKDTKALRERSGKERANSTALSLWFCCFLF
jgi:multidrug resistance efflux pump